MSIIFAEPTLTSRVVEAVVNARTAGKRLAGIVAPFEKHIRGLETFDRDMAGFPSDVRAIAKAYMRAFVRAWWEFTP